jgi:long-chain acyl-CoA synthetase
MPSPEGTLAWPLEHAARVHARRVAVVEGARELTYAELGRRVRGLGGALDDLGVAPGAFVGVLTLNSLAQLECWLGVPGYGRVINALNVRLAPPELEELVADSGTEVLVVDDAHLETARGLRERCDTLRQLVHTGPGPCPEDCASYEALVAGPEAAPPDLPDDALAAVSYTGGTTGRPKGVMLSHRNLLANAKHYSMAVGHGAGDRYLHVARCSTRPTRRRPTA